MSRMYDNKPLSALPVENITWKTAWCPSTYQTGPGVIIEGCIKGRSRHVVISTDGKRTRYMALYVSVRRAHRRRFDASGVEVEPNFSETEKVRPVVTCGVLIRCECLRWFMAGLLTILANVIADIDIDTFCWNEWRYQYRYFGNSFAASFTDTFCCCNIVS